MMVSTPDSRPRSAAVVWKDVVGRPAARASPSISRPERDRAGSPQDPARSTTCSKASASLHPDRDLIELAALSRSTRRRTSGER